MRECGEMSEIVMSRTHSLVSGMKLGKKQGA